MFWSRRISKDHEVVLKQVTFHAIFEAKRLNSPFALLHFRGGIPGESLILWYCRCGTGSCCLPSPWEAGWRRTYGARCTSGQPRTHSSPRCCTRACGAGREASGAVRGVTGATGDAGTAGRQAEAAGGRLGSALQKAPRWGSA
jgi:hypothetical protein